VAELDLKKNQSERTAVPPQSHAGGGHRPRFNLVMDQESETLIQSSEEYKSSRRIFKGKRAISLQSTPLFSRKWSPLDGASRRGVHPRGNGRDHLRATLDRTGGLKLDDRAKNNRNHYQGASLQGISQTFILKGTKRRT